MDNDYITSIEVCYMLGVAETTLRNWYKWYKIREVDCPELPQPTKIKNRNYWKRSDMGLLFAFKQWVPHGRNGKMSAVNHKYWSSSKKKQSGKLCGEVENCC